MFQCDASHKFHYPAKLTAPSKSNPIIIQTDILGSFTVADISLEFSVCPFCQSKTFTEYIEPEADVSAVYVHDLTSGDQTILSTLLAEGWKIVNRYAKQYHLEKPKAAVVKVEQPDPDANEAFQEQAETAYKKLDEAKQP